MLHAGEEIGRYRVEGVIGQGGLARVYRVRHTTLGSVMALKVLVVRGAAIGRRLIREGRIQARLAHPNVVNVTDVVEHNGYAGLLMEYVEGVGLDGYLGRSGALPITEALSIFDQVMAGMIAAHDAQILHRDLKPANILLAAGAQGTIAKVTDFGIAKLLQSGDDETGGDTLQGDLIGTPGYMPPEQVADPTSLDERADIYSLGAVLYCMVTGRPPFLPGPSLAETLNQAQNGLFPPVLELRPDCPAHIATVIEACLSPSPDGRPPSVRALARAIHGDDHGLLGAKPSAAATDLGAPLYSETLAPLTASRMTAVPEAPDTMPPGAPDTMAPELAIAGAAVPSAQEAASLDPDRAGTQTGEGVSEVSDVPTLPASGVRVPWGWVGLGLVVGGVLLAVLLRGGTDPSTPGDRTDGVRAPVAVEAPTARSEGAPGKPPAAADDPASAGPPPGTDDPPPAASAPGADGAAGVEPAPPAPAPKAAEPTPDVVPAPGVDPSADREPVEDTEPVEPDVAAAAPVPVEDNPPPSEDDAVADATPPEGDADAAPAAPPEAPAALSVLGTWKGRWGGRPAVLRILRQDSARVGAELDVLVGQTYRTFKLSGTVDTDGHLELAESGGGWSVAGTVAGAQFAGTIMNPDLRKPMKLTATRQ